VSVPGPGGAAWAVQLLLLAAMAVVVGEAVRLAAARWVGAWRGLDAIERGLLDFYLGGAAVYLVAALPIGAFGLALLVGLPVAGLAVVLGWYLGGRGRRPGGARAALARTVRPGPLLALASALALFGLELAVALPVGTGNTYDSSLLTLYTALLLQHHSIALSFAPYAPVGLLYPQGTTVWLGSAQLLFGLPAARTSLLVTPLFLGLAPLGGFVVGRRWFGTDRAGVALALGLAFLGPGTRGMTGGSNDFVVAFPLVLLLLGQSVAWVRRPGPTWADAAAFGLVAGYSAALNPVGAQWLLLAVLVAGAFARPAYAGAAGRWFARWGLAAGAALVALVPTWVVLAEGIGSPGYVSGSGAPPPGAATGLSPTGWVASVDPYLFGPEHVALSSIPLLTVELALLLTAGAGLLLWAARASPLGRYLETARLLLGAGIVAIVALLGVLVAAGSGFGPAVAYAHLTSSAELSIWLFALYGIVAVLPLALAFEAIAAARARTPTAGRSPPRRARWRLPGRPEDRATVAAAAALAVAVVVPGLVLTPTALPVVLRDLYQDFGNVTADDLSVLAYAGAHLPSGARVLVAPGSAGQFLPGYAADVVLLFPMVPGWPWLNASYRLLVSQLTNGTLNASGESALGSLDVGYVIVTGNSTVLWPAFSPAPLLADPDEFAVLDHAGDAYLFERYAG